MASVEKWCFGIEGKPQKASKNRGETPKKSTKYAIRSLNNDDFSREMALFEHVLRFGIEEKL